MGVDWAEGFQLVALGTPDQGIMEVLRVEHRPEAVAQLLARIAALEPDPAELRVVIETRHGLLVEAFWEAGFTVLPVNPELIARRPGPQEGRCEDARIACLVGLDPYAKLKPLIPHGELASELRAIARDDEQAAQDQRRLLNRLRMDLLSTFGAALEIAGDDLGAPTRLRPLERWPTQEQLAGATREEPVTFARAAHHGRPERFADRVQDALRHAHFQARPGLVRAKAQSIRLAARQLLLITEQRKLWERRMGALLLGIQGGGATANLDPMRGKGRSLAAGSPSAFPGSVTASPPGGEIGDHLEQFETPNSLPCDAGKAPVTRRSGKSELAVAHRLAGNRHLANAVQQWAFCSISRSTWARAFSEAQRARGKGHHAALRALGNRWLEVLWHCLKRSMPYDEVVHLANRNRALGNAA